MKCVLVDAKDRRTLQGDAFGCLAAVKAVVNALNGGGADLGKLGHDFAGNAFMMKPGDALPERLGTLFSGHDTRQSRIIGFCALWALITGVSNVKDTLLCENLQMTNPAPLRRVDLRSPMRTPWTGWPLGRRILDAEIKFLVFKLAFEHAKASNSDLLNHWGHDDDFGRFMSPFFYRGTTKVDVEPF